MPLFKKILSWFTPNNITNLFHCRFLFLRTFSLSPGGFLDLSFKCSTVAELFLEPSLMSLVWGSRILKRWFHYYHPSTTDNPKLLHLVNIWNPQTFTPESFPSSWMLKGQTAEMKHWATHFVLLGITGSSARAVDQNILPVIHILQCSRKP